MRPYDPNMDDIEVFSRAAIAPTDSPARFTLNRRRMIQLLVGAAILPTIAGAPVAARAEPSASAGEEGAALLTDALRRTDMPELAFEELGRIANDRYRVTFSRATWVGGRTIVRDVEVKEGGAWVAATEAQHRLEEQWVVFTGDHAGSPWDYYTTMSPEWVGFDECVILSADTAELRARTASTSLTVRWSLAGTHPELQWVVTSDIEQHVLVGYQAADPVARPDIEEVLCGAIQHARVVGGVEFIGAWEMFTPTSLVQHSAAGRRITGGVYVPAEVIEFVHEREYGPNSQPWGMTLRNEERRVQPSAVAPQAGDSSLLAAGQSRGFAFGLYFGACELWEAYEELARQEYGLSRYREHVFGTSLTDAVHNMVDLIAIEPQPSADGRFVPSFSGWWPRGKGWADLEWDGNVRTAVASIPLSAYHLLATAETADHLYADRALPLIELHVSRRHVGSTPYIGTVVPEGAGGDRLGGIVGDASTLVPISRQLRGGAAGIIDLANKVIANPPVKSSRTPMNTPLAAYELTSDPSWLAEAHAVARLYVRRWLQTPYSEGGRAPDFAWNLVKGWVELMLIAEKTGDEELLSYAHAEVRRFVTLTQLRPIPNTTVTVPTAPVQLQERWTEEWESGPIFADYPLHDIEPETVPAWMVSTSGLTFEQLSTYHIAPPAGGFVMNATWAGMLLTLADRVDDDVLRDVAHNLIVGRFGNYPGYYFRQSTARPLHADFPLTGPHGLTSIYHHHAPAQLGLTLDYLFAEHETRSGGEVAFPWHYEVDFVYFRYRVFGHAPGTFYGHENVWPYLPRGLVTLDNPQVNWLGGVSEDALHVSLTNNSAREQRVRVTFEPTLTGVTKPIHEADVLDARKSRWQLREVKAGSIIIVVPAKGHAALVIRGVGDHRQPWHRSVHAVDRSANSYAFETLPLGGDAGTMRGILIPRPDGSAYDAYIQLDWQQPAALSYRIGGGASVVIDDGRYPNEWTIRVDDPTAPFTFRVNAGGAASAEHRLSLSPIVTGKPDSGTSLSARLSVPQSTTPGDRLKVEVFVAAADEGSLDEADVQLTVPNGWSATPVDTASTADGMLVSAWNVDVPSDAEPRGHEIASHVSAGENQADAPAAVVEVRRPVRVLDVTASAVQILPGATTTVTTTVVNLGPLGRDERVSWAVPTGWTVSESSTQLRLDPRGDALAAVELTAPANTQRGSTHRVSATLSDGSTTNLTIRIQPVEIVITPKTEWPEYGHQGWWLESSLAGYAGTPTYYNDIEEGLGTGVAHWRPDIPETGWFEVAVWYPPHPTSTTAAVYRVNCADGIFEQSVDQTQNGGAWRVLGVYRFEAGTAGAVQLQAAADGFRRVNSARFTPTTNQPPALTIDPVIQAASGGQVEVNLHIAALGSPVDSAATLALPGGWLIEPTQHAVRLAPQQHVDVTFRITPPTGAPTDTLFEGRASLGPVSEPFVAQLGDASSAIQILDTGSDRYSETGTWYQSSLAGYNGTPSRFAVGGTAEASASWSPALTEPGRYLISVWYPTNPTTTDRAHFEITDAAGDVTTVIVNQRERADRWRPLSFATLTPDLPSVRLVCISPGYHRTSAAAFIKVVPLDG